MTSGRNPTDQTCLAHTLLYLFQRNKIKEVQYAASLRLLEWPDQYSRPRRKARITSSHRLLARPSSAVLCDYHHLATVFLLDWVRRNGALLLPQ